MAYNHFSPTQISALENQTDGQNVTSNRRAILTRAIVCNKSEL